MDLTVPGTVKFLLEADKETSNTSCHQCRMSDVLFAADLSVAPYLC